MTDRYGDEGHRDLVQMTVRVPRALRRRVHVRCVEVGMTVQDFVAEAARAYLRRHARHIGARPRAGARLWTNVERSRYGEFP